MPAELDELQRFILDRLRTAGRPQMVEALAWYWHNRDEPVREKTPPRVITAQVLRAVNRLAADGLIRSGMVDVLASKKGRRVPPQQLACWLDGQELLPPPPAGP